ncbi:hypothetical protein HPB47_016853 [Ixodes persulcatus]|uniref:Uncharacterized protein n=1 Tax=Ixodes persulcatus TaxID=34615 RepID=A0AC60QQV2_IXOPE|nr:hypothetical protein HPB47_016853 [Ixodes persulcatus]
MDPRKKSSLGLQSRLGGSEARASAYGSPCGGFESRPRFEVMRGQWKMVVVPGIPFGNGVTCLSSTTRNFIETRQREAGRMALRAPSNSPNEAVQGDLGWSGFEVRETVAKTGYERGLARMDHARWAHKEEEQRRWRDVMSRKPSLLTYSSHKDIIKKEEFYDNTKGSGLLFQARAGTLGTKTWRAKFTEELETLCTICRTDTETIDHIVIACRGLTPQPVTDSVPEALGFTVAVETEEGRERRVAKRAEAKDVIMRNPELRFHQFLRDRKGYKVWVCGVCRRDFGRPSIPSSNAKLCSQHFTSDTYTRDLQLLTVAGFSPKHASLKNDAVPSLFAYRPPAAPAQSAGCSRSRLI